MFTDETLLTFGEAVRELPAPNGRKVHVSTLWRWSREGLNGVRLETVRFGRRLLTSVEAVERFCDRVARQDAHEIRQVSAPRRSPEQTRSATRREQDIERAQRQLDGPEIDERQS